MRVKIILIALISVMALVGCSGGPVIGESSLTTSAAASEVG